ncbi:MAG: M56 family metallopeptidase [Reichenbachiella sp.]|uniref:M56 family metallopeptidase n=1 Tax=Reichenbachiella sp. TaxID=2184521 RepID=UPI0032665254
MNSILNFYLESGFSIALLTLFYTLVLRQEKSFVFNRFYLISSVLLSLLIPFLRIDLDTIGSQTVGTTLLLDTVEFGNQLDQSTFLNPGLWIWLYTIVSSMLLFRIFYQVRKLLKHEGISVDHHDHRLITLRDSVEAYSFLNMIYLGDQIPEAERSAILAHERVHVMEKHSIDVLLFEIISAVLWINPIYYLLKRLARANHEFLADAHAVNGYNKEQYVKALASHAIQKQGLSLAHPFYTSSTLKRIKMIYRQNNKTMKIKQILPFGLAFALIVIFGCEDAAQQLSEQDDITAAKTISDYTMKDGAYDMVDVQPAPAGGMTEFYSYITQNLKYPTAAKEAGVEGRVFVQFILDESGNFKDVKAIKGIGSGCDKAAVEIVKNAPKWTPGLIDGKAVSVRMVLPISFHLGKG